jgi:hypothetical protein
MNERHPAGMPITFIHQPIGNPPSVAARLARGLLVAAPSLALWLAAAAIHDLVTGALHMAARERPAPSTLRGTHRAPAGPSMELVAPQVGLAARVAVAEHHEATIDRGRPRA